MDGRRNLALVSWGAPLCLLLAVAQGAYAQSDDPIALQRQAIQQLDAFVAHARKTGDLRSRVRDLAQIDAALTASNQMLAARGDWSALVLGLIKQGHVYRMQSNWQAAVGYYQQAEQAARRAGSIVQQADALAWKSLAESNRRNYGQAAADGKEAVRLAEKAGDNDVLARALDVLGAAQIYQLDLAGAADTINREVEVAKQAKDPMTPYFAYLNRGEVYKQYGQRCDFQRSFEACKQALERARTDYQKALAIVRELGHSALVRQTEQLLQVVEFNASMNRFTESNVNTLSKTDIFHPKTLSNVVVTERFVPEPSEPPPALVAMYEDTKRLASRGFESDGVDMRNAFTEGRLNEMRGNNDAAQAFYLKAVKLLENDRRSLRDERSRGTFMADRVVFYYAVVQQLLEHRRYAEAFEMFERSRSRSLADLLATRKLGLGRPEEQKLYAESAQLRTEIADAQGRLFELTSQGDAANRSQIATLQGQIRALEDRFQKVSSRIAVESPRLQSLLMSTPASLAALQQSMRAERYELLQYLVQDTGVIVWHISADSVFVRNVFLPRDEVIRKVSSLQKSLSDRNAPFDETTAQELFLYLIAPVLPRIRSDRLVIVPHDDLTYIPFQVFKDPADGRYLGERFHITYAPSATVLLGLRPSPGLIGARLLAVADPGIAAAGPEVRGIAKLFPNRSKIVTDALAREGEIKTWVRDFDVIHLSVHGKFDAAEPMLSHLSFAPAAEDDGRLTAAEMFGLPLDQSRLVVLSACETGRAEATHGNEILGMVRALLYAGANTLVVSYWEVDSAATALWMQRFYEAALTQPLPQAARAALLAVKNDPAYRHPFFWAAFGMVGR
jgi:CHAT domain-containing protein